MSVNTRSALFLKMNNSKIRLLQTNLMMNFIAKCSGNSQYNQSKFFMKKIPGRKSLILAFLAFILIAGSGLYYFFQSVAGEKGCTAGNQCHARNSTVFL